MARDDQYDQYKKEKSVALKSTRHFVEKLLLTSFKGLAGCLSIGANQWVGRGLGRLLYRYSKKDIGVGAYQLAFALPELSASEHQELLKESALNVGQTLFEALAIQKISKNPERWITIEGRDIIEDLKAQGKGALVLFGHFGNWELIPVVYQMLDIQGVAPESPIGVPGLDKMLIDNRTNDHFTVVPRGTANSAKQMLGCLKNGGFYLMAIDQDLAKVQNLFVDFFGKPAATSQGAANVAQRFKVPVLSVFGKRLADGTHHYKIQKLSSPEYESSDQETFELTQRYTQAIEAHIRETPGQWVWFHRRWKTRPEGEA